MNLTNRQILMSCTAVGIDIDEKLRDRNASATPQSARYLANNDVEKSPVVENSTYGARYVCGAASQQTGVHIEAFSVWVSTRPGRAAVLPAASNRCCYCEPSTCHAQSSQLSQLYWHVRCRRGRFVHVCRGWISGSRATLACKLVANAC